jgi:hypothetical protein
MNFTFVTAAVVFSSVATASVPAVRPIVPSPQAPAAIRVSLAAGWGVVEAIRRVEHGGAAPVSFEFTVRMRDGTTRTSSSASASKWRNGDRIMLIGGVATPAITH